MKRVKAAPGARRLIESLRDMGYDCPTAVADLVDLEKTGVNVEPMRALFRQNRIISSIAAELDQKSCFELLTDPQLTQKYFSADERQVFRRHVLWTRLLSDRRTLLPDGQELPGGLRTLYDGRSRDETPLWLPEQRALVFADGLTAPGGELRVWRTPWHEQAVLPALRALLELPFEVVIVAHGEPVHDRAAFERALELPPGP